MISKPPFSRPPSVHFSISQHVLYTGSLLHADEPQPKKLTVKASWVIKRPATAMDDVKTERGSMNLPVITTKECEKKFKIEKFAFSLDTKDLAKHLAGIGSIANIEIRLVKLFQGRGATPDVILEQENGKRAGFALFNAIDVDKWPQKNYRFGGIVDAGDILFPPHWEQIELRCN